MFRKIILNLVKFGFAGGLLYWLINSGKLEFNLLFKIIQSPMTVLIAFLVYQFDQIINTSRYGLILTKNLKEVSILKLYLINWIGLFFSSVLPGSVTGDLVKIFYVKDLKPELSKKFLVFSVFFDRVVGLSGLIVIGGFISLLSYSNFTKISDDLVKLAQINIFLTLCVLTALSLLFVSPRLPHRIFSPFKRVSSLKKILLKIENLWERLVIRRKKFTALLILGMLAQTINGFVFWFLTKNYAEGADLDMVTVLAIFPIGQISMALPIAPAGLGVGHAVFGKLLSFFNISNGASLFNIFFFFNLFSNILGVFSYIFYSTKGSKKFHINESLEENLEDA